MTGPSASLCRRMRAGRAYCCQHDALGAACPWSWAVHMCSVLPTGRYAGYGMVFVTAGHGRFIGAARMGTLVWAGASQGRALQVTVDGARMRCLCKALYGNSQSTSSFCTGFLHWSFRLHLCPCDCAEVSTMGLFSYCNSPAQHVLSCSLLAGRAV